MSTQEWTIQLRTNFSDRDKDEEAKKAVVQAARHLHALMLLIHDGIEPDIAAYSDNWMAGRKEINLVDDIIQRGITESDGDGVSSDLLSALIDSQHSSEENK